jgi:hypothetical protein
MFCLTATSVAGAITFKMNHEGNSVACREERKFLMDWDAELHTAAQLAAYDQPYGGHSEFDDDAYNERLKEMLGDVLNGLKKDEPVSQEES